MLKILQARLQQYMNHEVPDVQAGFRKGRATRDEIANIHWIIEKARVPEKHLFLLSWRCQRLWLCGSQETVENSERDGTTRPPDLPPEKSVCTSGSNSENWTWNYRLVPNRKRSTSRLYIVTLLIGFSRHSSGGLVFPSLSEFSTVYCDPHSERLWHSQ